MPDKDRTTLESVWSPIYGLDGQDIISQLFSDEELKCISDIEPEYDTSSDLEINEKCYITLCGMPDVRRLDPLSTAVDIANTVDFDKYRYTILNPENEKEWDNDEDYFFIKDFFSSEKYYNMFCIAASLTDEEKKALDTRKSQILNGEEDDDESIPFIYKDNERLKAFYIHVIAAMIENNSLAPYLEKANPDEEFETMRISKAFVKTFKEKYDIWEGCVTDVIKQVKFLNMSLFPGILANNLEARQLVHALFLIYYEAYSDNWKNTLFEGRLREQCNNPVNALKFANALKTQKYCREFCREYEDYIEEKGIRPLFNTSIVVPAIPDLEIDKDESHKDWFVEIDRVKAKNDKKKNLYNALYNLCEWLKGVRYIPEDTSVDLFIYRFSGYLAPKPLELEISWNGKKNILAFILKCLFTRKEGESIISPPYKKLLVYFGLQKINGSALADSLDNKKQKDIIQRLELCGFKNVTQFEVK